MRFEWDENKNESNIHKHGLDFSDSIEMFDSPMVTCPDNRFDYGEERYIGIGLTQNRVAIVVFTEKNDDVICIISLRKAKKHEHKIFEKQIKNRLG